MEGSGGSPAPASRADARASTTQTTPSRRGGHHSRGRAARSGGSLSREENPGPGLEATVPESDRTDAIRTERSAAGRAANRRRNRRGGDGREAPSGHRNERARGPGGRGRGRGRGRGGIMRGVGGHAFGGHLTSTASTAGSALHADAPAFTPGLPVPSRAPPSTASPTERSFSPVSRKDSSFRSTAPDIATRTHQDIAHGLYECSICTNDIRINSKVWSCHTCWTVFHLSCIKKWSKNEGSTVARQGPVDETDPAPRQWRCPGCNLPKDELPSRYTCWCEKETDPRPIGGVPPHSCGQTCSKSRALPKQCPHPCELTCHAGPCPPCAHMGPVQSCFCGREALSRRCIETNYLSGWSCEQTCGDVMPCGEHECPRSCHEGLCGACEVRVDATCYCGKVQKTMLCTDQQDPKKSAKAIAHGDDDTATYQEWNGTFNCGDVCGRAFDCGKHVCEKGCHAQDSEASHCPRAPDIVITCPCGKTALTEISNVTRQSCEDPIPNCSKVCSKNLACGHRCQRTCHLGICPPCAQMVNVTCRCGRTTNEIKCHQKTNETLVCTRTCKATLDCGRHECGEQCCAGEKKASERLTQRKKTRRLDAGPVVFDENIEAEHICTRVCGRPLKCGSHNCPELCHRGPCNSCRDAIFEEVSCNCGKTVLHPPLPCGTGPPPCRFPCERPKACGHPTVAHNCHGDEEPCPSCPYLTEKVCLCKRKTLKNQPCFRTEVICGEICGKRLRCGSHFCRKPCHRPGECEDAVTRCQQPCGDPKKACSHPCEERCHNPSACKEDKPCGSKLFITCDCQNLKTETRCLATRTSDGNKNKKLKCDEECARLQRNHQLALALNVDPAHQDNHVPYSNQTLQLYQDDITWAQAQERELRVFAADDAERRLRCKPAPPHRRAFLHALAEDFGFDSESVDPEPHRHVFIFKTPRFVKAPMKVLAECVRIRATSIGMATPTSRLSTQQTQLTTDNEPFNGFVLSAPRFALTIEELRVEAASATAPAKTLVFDIEFLPSEEIIFKARPSSPSTTIAPRALENLLKSLKPAFTAEIVGKKLAGTVALCSLDQSLNILRRETTEAPAGSGWNRVAARAALPKAPLRVSGPAAVGQKSSFTVLSKRKDTEKKKEAPVAVVDDWEEEIRREEEQEQDAATSTANDPDNGTPDTTNEVKEEDTSVHGAESAAVIQPAAVTQADEVIATVATS